MKRVLVVTIFLMLGLGPASIVFAADSSASGPAALALAAVVARHAPVLSPHEKDALARLFNGEVNLAFTASRKILREGRRRGLPNEQYRYCPTFLRGNLRNTENYVERPGG